MNADDVSFAVPPRRRSPVPMIAGIALVAFVIGIAVTYWWVIPALDRLGVGRAAPSPIVVQPQALTPAPAQPLPPGTDLASLYAREIALAARIQGLEARLSTIDSDSRVASTFATRAEGLLVAFAARRALDRGLPLGYLEDQLRDRFGAAQPRAVAYVIQSASAPVTLEDLRAGLETIAPDLVSGGRETGWFDAARREIGGLVSLRESDSPSGRPADRLLRARRMLGDGQVEGALAEVARMPGAADATSWIEAARRYVYARRALNSIEAAAIEGVERPALPLGVIPAPAPPPVVTPAN